jgi:polyhydroxyalkanoate synthesis regulator phasin
MSDANGLAAIAILGSLVDALVKKGTLSKDEARAAVVGAYGRVGGRPETIEATNIIGDIVKRLT